ncbi:hypothetical protein IZ6_07470 [Terrihabitans soli]|uniref:Uncharacterized protein n=1 Tax=Terrihabitans soli TaxID=708113 RepID=A0A6S6QRV8_9HYPH|nr:hypothetical protein [Terrihabitans soli]BCJ90012.1 hypothetical protein IZ6_07470 [Terrihabitans soli]
MIAAVTAQRAFRTEFPDFPEADLPELPPGFTDESWRNDTCPSFHNAAARLTLYCDYADPASRDHPEVPRYSLYETDEDGCLTGTEIVSTDDWTIILAKIEARA